MSQLVSECLALLPTSFSVLSWHQPDPNIPAIWAATQTSLSPPGWPSFEQGWVSQHCWLAVEAVDGGWFWLLSVVEGL